MNHLFLFWARSLGRAAVFALVLLAGLSLRPGEAQASHIRAGDIQAKIDTTANPNPRRVFFKMVLYLDIVSQNPPVDQPTATIFFGDGTSSCLDGVRRDVRRVLPGNPDTSINIYYFEHTFPSTGSFLVSFIGENRNRGVLNMDQSDRQSFYISTRITLDAALGLNRSPVLTAPAIDKAATGQVFLHSPGGFDADGDSLAYKLVPSQYSAILASEIVGPPCPGATGNNTPTPLPSINYRLPNDPSVAPNPVQVAYNGVPVGVPRAPAIFVQDVQTGLIVWNAPVQNGVYNVAFVVEEWRRTALGRRKIGEVIRDMQIIVAATSNIRPTITIPADICVVAGQRVTGTVTAVDGSSPNSPATPVTLSAFAGIIPPATFVQTQTGPPQAVGTFNWQTDCSNVAQQPYNVVFKAQDTPTGLITTNPPLIDERVWRITVVGPPPANLRAVPTVGAGGNPNSVTLNWNTYVCANASRIHIYRKVNSGASPGPCETGIPASLGYTRIATVNANVTTFIDNNPNSNGTVQGLERGQTYCYRIYAEFPLPKGGNSIASAEACATFPGAAARLIKVDVENTSTTAGRIGVCWTKPVGLSTNPADGTPSYVLSRGQGLAPTTFTQVATLTSLNDTCYTDTNINTQDLQFTYKLDLVRTFPAGDSRPPVVESSPTASSVRTTAIPADATASSVSVRWTYNVPWDNSAQPAVIFRRSGNGTGPFVQVGTAPTTATGGTFVDRDPALRRDETYCYYVQTTGRYAGVPYLNALVNRSQQQCVVLTSPPCTPVLTLQTTNCDSLANLQEFPGLGQRYTNRLRWTLGNTPTGCDDNITNYRVYYRPTPSGRFSLIETTTQTSFVHRDLEFSGGCYAVLAIGRSGLASDTSNIACQDNCVFFKLPNIFTPTGDGINDIFRPKNNSPIRSVHFTAFNRWGVKVFENTTTTADRFFINWDGGGPVGESGKGVKVVDGVYFYLAEVEFADFANTKRTYKGWVEIVR